MHFWKEATEILKRCKIDFIATCTEDDTTPTIKINGYQLNGQSKGNRINFYFMTNSKYRNFSDYNLNKAEREEIERIKPPSFHNQLKDSNFIKGLNLWLAFMPKHEQILKSCFDRVEAQEAVKNKILSSFKDFSFETCQNDKYNTSARFRKYDPDLKLDFSFYNDKPAQIYTLEIGRLSIDEGLKILSLLYSLREIKPV